MQLMVTSDCKLDIMSERPASDRQWLLGSCRLSAELHDVNRGIAWINDVIKAVDNGVSSVGDVFYCCLCRAALFTTDLCARGTAVYTLHDDSFHGRRVRPMNEHVRVSRVQHDASPTAPVPSPPLDCRSAVLLTRAPTTVCRRYWLFRTELLYVKLVASSLGLADPR